jgi:CubicO group peptidase (beta-lactamase class C family)
VFGRPISHNDVVANVMEGIKELSGPKFPAGSEMSYSNTGYLLIAEIINIQTGQDIETWVNQLIFEPYKMDDSSLFQETSTDLNGIATGYELSPHQGQKYRSLIESLASIGDGGMLTTIRDFAKWMEVLNNSDRPESDWFGFLVNPFEGDQPSTEVSWYQNGLGIEKYQGLIYEHSGRSTDNMNSDFWISPEHNVGYVRFCNFENLTRHRKADVFDYVDVSGSK